MDAERAPPAAWRFDRFTLDIARGALLGPDGAEVPLRPKSLALLRLLVENANRVVDRDAIMTAVWPDVVVGDESITQCVRDVRKALGDEAQQVLKTVPKRGYLFAAEAVPAETTAPTPRVERRLAAILAADIVGYSRLIEQDEAATLAAIKGLREQAIDPLLAEHKGRIVKLMGDGAIVEFASVVDAVACAVAVQKAVADRQAKTPADRRIVFRIGVNLGDVVVEGDDLLGDGVNVAARLEQLCEPGGVLVSGTAYDHLQGRLGMPLEFTGEQQVKNIARPVRAYRVRLDGVKLSARPSARQLHRLVLGAAAALCAAVFAGGVWWFWPVEPPSGPAASGAEAAASALDPRRLAVLPFTNISADAKDEWFADGLTEEMITLLSKIPDLGVIARTSIMGYKGSQKGIAEIGRELGAGTILEGSVRRADDQVRVTAQLIDSRSQVHLWAESYDRPLADIFAIQSDVAQQVAKALQIALLGDVKQRVDRSGTSDPIAHDLYLKARSDYYLFSPDRMEQAIAGYQAATSRDPSYAMAYVGLAQAWVDAPWVLPVPPREALAKGTAAAEQALALDEALAEAHALLANAKLYAWDWPGAEAGFKRALELNPNSAWTLDQYSWGYLTQVRGQYEAALVGMRHARKLDPLNGFFVSDLGWILYHAGRYDAAIEQFQQSFAFFSDNFWPYVGIGSAYVALGRFDEAIPWLQKGVDVSGGDPMAKAHLGRAYGKAGQKDQAQGILDELTRRYPQEKFSPMTFVFVYGALGDLDNAFSWLERCYETQNYYMPFLQSREFDDLWGDPRYAAMKARIGFPPRAASKAT